LEDSYVVVPLNDIPKQTNSYDCGIYVLMYAEAILQAYLDKHNLELLEENSIAFFDHITPKFITKKRE
jgi:Ulp1 family protease